MLHVKIGNKTLKYSWDLESYFNEFRKEIIGIDTYIPTPLGMKKIVYADWTASGRLYNRIEQKMTDEIGPYVANTHTDANYTSSFITDCYREAKKIIKKHVNAGLNDVLIVDGSGMTSVVNKFQRILGLRVPENLKKLHQEERPVVFITHMEHHSNQLPWLECNCDVVVLEPGSDGHINLKHLEEMLKKYQDRKLKIGAFTACSNVTGIQTPYHKMAAIMHKYDGVCFVDFAASAPYVKIDMHPIEPEERLDAVYFSPHKFLGGPGSSGVLIFDSALYKSKVPDNPGGGTVTWTNPWGGHKYASGIEEREDGGTPGFLQTIRASMAIRLKEKMGEEKMLLREKEQLAILFDGLERIPNLKILDGQIKERLGIISFFIKGMHYNLIVKLLNDRFGIQARGGCSCAGTYGHYLMGISESHSKEITDYIDKGDLSVKPGWVRISIHPTMTNDELYRIINAIESIAQRKQLWKRDYTYDKRTNSFQHFREKRRDIGEVFKF
ncbi:MAG TPA: selenocysteine lyase [Bacillus bacterium]|nr:selenocysteine lyase [Bacillus sp. (in: firmicutes)]